MAARRPPHAISPLSSAHCAYRAPTSDLRRRSASPPALVDELAQLGITSPFPIQVATLPDALVGP